MAEQPNRAADRTPVDAQVVPEHLGLPLDHRQQARAGTQQGGLAGAVRSLEQHDLAAGDVEVDAGEGGEAAKESNGGPEADGGGHGDGTNGTGGRGPSSMRAAVASRPGTARPGSAGGPVRSPGMGKRRFDWRTVARGVGKTL